MVETFDTPETIQNPDQVVARLLLADAMLWTVAMQVQQPAAPPAEQLPTNVATMLTSPDATIRADGLRLQAMLTDPNNEQRRNDARIVAAIIDDPRRLHEMLDLMHNPAHAVFARELINRLANQQGRAHVAFVLDGLAGRVPAGANPQRPEDWAPQAAAIFGITWLETLRNLFRARQPGAPADMVPHIGENRFTVPMGGEVTLRQSGGALFFFDGAPERTSSDVVVLRRTERGWQARVVGEGFHHRPAGSNEFRPVAPGTSVVIGANDQVRLGPADSTQILTFRPPGPPAPPPEAGQPQMRVNTQGTERLVDIVRPDGSTERVRLIAHGGFLVAQGPSGSHESTIKVHIAVQNMADLARLQPHVMDALMNDPVLRRLVTGWKTLDPNHALGESARAYGVAPTGEGQGAKGFTIYCANAEDAFLIQERLSQILAERGLALPAPPGNNNVDRLDTRTNRVGLVRDTWPITEDAGGSPGYLLDAELARRIGDHFQLPEGQRLSAAQRRQLERDLGLKPNTITYDHNGHLMLRAHTTRGLAYHGGAYADESRARTPEGLADRPALYALYRRFRLDPTDLAGLTADNTAGRPSGVLPENLQREFTQIADRLSNDPFLRNTALSEFQRRVEELQNQLRNVADPAARNTAIRNSLQQMIRDMAPHLGNSIVGQFGNISLVPAPELDLSGAPQARHVFRRANGETIRPLRVEGGNAIYQSTDWWGRPVERSIPLSQLTLEIQVPPAALAADLSSEAGAARFRRMLANVYEQLDRAHRRGSLTPSEAANPRLSDASMRTGNIIADYLNRELQAAADPFTRRSPNFTGLSQDALNRTAETMVNAFNNRPITEGLMSDRALEHFVGQFRSRATEIFSQAGADARATEIQRLVREMVARPGMQIGIDPSRISIEASSTVTGGGQQLIRHHGSEGQPAIEGVLVGREGNNVQIRLPTGEVVTRPVGEVSLVIRLPEAQLLHATGGGTADGVTPHTRASAHELASSVYRFLAQADAVLNRRAPAGTGTMDIAGLSELVARRVQYELNAQRLTVDHNLPPVHLSQIDIARVITGAQPRGVIHATVVNGVTRYELVDGSTRRTLTEEERERLDRNLREHFERVYGESITRLRERANDRSLSPQEREDCRLALEAMERDLQLYRTCPHRQAEVHNSVPRNLENNSNWRARLGTGTRVVSSAVIILILAETARNMLQRPGTGGGLQVVPVQGGGS